MTRHKSLDLLLMLLLVAAVGGGSGGGGQDHLYLGPNASPRMTQKEEPTVASENSAYWDAKCQADLAQQLEKKHIVKKAKNVIVFLADGAGIATFTAARMLKGQRTGHYEQEQMAWEKFPYSSIIKTYNTNMQTTDSAASATAYLAGVKANQATLGVDANVRLGDCDAMNNPAFHTHSIMENFQTDNRSTGFVTVSRVTHASPAGNYAHTAERHWENDVDINDMGGDSEKCADIAEQLVYSETGKNIKVILGGGRRNFLPKGVEDPEGGTLDRRADGKNLIEDWKFDKAGAARAAYVWNRTELRSIDTDNTDYLLGLFDYSHMSFAIDHDESNPRLSEMTQTAIEMLQKDENGFYLFVEGGLIDTAHHMNQPKTALEEALEFELAVLTALEMTSEDDTLIVVTADHSQPMTINGYTPRGHDILGLGDTSDVDNLPFTTLMYTNGPGYKYQQDGVRPNPADEDYASPHYASASTVPMTDSHHGGEDVILYARGPHSYLFTGIHENAYIPHAIRYASCVGTGLSYCD